MEIPQDERGPGRTHLLDDQDGLGFFRRDEEVARANPQPWEPGNELGDVHG